MRESKRGKLPSKRRFPQTNKGFRFPLELRIRRPEIGEGLAAPMQLRARAEINSHFGASAGRADARRRDEVDVGHRRGAATKPIRTLAAAPLRAAARRPAAKCKVISARAL